MKWILMIFVLSVVGCSEEDCRKASSECATGFMCVQNQDNEFECIPESSMMTGGEVNGGSMTGGEVVNGGSMTGGEVVNGGSMTGGEVVNGGSMTGGEVVNGGMMTGGEVVNGGTTTGGEVVNGGMMTGGEVVNGGMMTEENLPPCSPNCPNLDFVRIAGGTFSMGSMEMDDEQPIHMVNVPAFEMMRTEVTVGMYRKCVDANVCSSPAREVYTLVENSSFNWDFRGRENHPVNGLSWNQLNDFAEWVGARLPTEAEWEYAARGGNRDVRYLWGNTEPNCSYADFAYVLPSSCNGSGTSPVCNTPNGNSLDGLCDMVGNVREWVQDPYNSHYHGAPNDGSAWWCVSDCTAHDDNNLRVVRGGSWKSYRDPIRVSSRYWYDPHDNRRGEENGGRLARSLIP